MAKLTWVLYNSDAANDFTSSVQSFTYTQGRQSVLDNYGGGTAQITMRNNTGQVATAFLAYRQKVLIKCEGTNAFIGWVQGIIYNDTPGNANDATAIITLGDAWVLAGQQIATSQVLTSNDFQVDEIAALQFYPNQFVQNTASTSIRGSLTFAGDWATRLNQIVASDRGVFQSLNGINYYYSLQDLVIGNQTLYEFGPTASAVVIAYESFNRIAGFGGKTFVNQAQVTPESLATQTATNATALVVSTSAITVASLNTTVTDGLNTATWIANSMGDDATQESYQITVKDISQTAVANLANMIAETWNLNMDYKPPGGVLTSERTLTEGITVRGFPDHTEVDFYLSPYTYYNYFILDDPVNGVLDSSRLGW